MQVAIDEESRQYLQVGNRDCAAALGGAEPSMHRSSSCSRCLPACLVPSCPSRLLLPAHACGPFGSCVLLIPLVVLIYCCVLQEWEQEELQAYAMFEAVVAAEASGRRGPGGNLASAKKLQKNKVPEEANKQ